MITFPSVMLPASSPDVTPGPDCITVNAKGRYRIVVRLQLLSLSGNLAGGRSFLSLCLLYNGVEDPVSSHNYLSFDASATSLTTILYYHMQDIDAGTVVTVAIGTQDASLMLVPNTSLFVERVS